MSGKLTLRTFVMTIGVIAVTACQHVQEEKTNNQLNRPVKALRSNEWILSYQLVQLSWMGAKKLSDVLLLFSVREIQ